VTLSIVVPATDEPASIDQCIAAVRLGMADIDELIVVREPPLVGPAAARNRGAAEAAGDVLVFVDSDVRVHPDALERVRHAFGQDGIHAVFGSYDDDPAAQSLVSRYRNLLHHFVHQQGAGEARTFWAGLGAIRRDAFVESGGFREQDYPRPSIEDIELGMRLVAAGKHVVLEPRIQGTHLKEWRLRDVIRTDFARRGVPWVRLMLRERALPSTLNLSWSHRLATLALLAGVGALARGRPRAAAPAGCAFLILNRRFYALVWRRGGPRATLAAIPLHALHHATAAAAVPTGIVLHLLERRRRPVTARLP
jgi:GT2 family glycosyltransferase